MYVRNSHYYSFYSKIIEWKPSFICDWDQIIRIISHESGFGSLWSFKKHSNWHDQQFSDLHNYILLGSWHRSPNRYIHKNIIEVEPMIIKDTWENHNHRSTFWNFSNIPSKFKREARIRNTYIDIYVLISRVQLNLTDTFFICLYMILSHHSFILQFNHELRSFL